MGAIISWGRDAGLTRRNGFSVVTGLSPGAPDRSARDQEGIAQPPGNAGSKATTSKRAAGGTPRQWRAARRGSQYAAAWASRRRCLAAPMLAAAPPKRARRGGRDLDEDQHRAVAHGQIDLAVTAGQVARQQDQAARLQQAQRVLVGVADDAGWASGAARGGLARRRARLRRARRAACASARARGRISSFMRAPGRKGCARRLHWHGFPPELPAMNQNVSPAAGDAWSRVAERRRPALARRDAVRGGHAHRQPWAIWACRPGMPAARGRDRRRGHPPAASCWTPGAWARRSLAAHRHNEASAAQAICARLASQRVALVSDAGAPAVSDPGARGPRGARGRLRGGAGAWPQRGHRGPDGQRRHVRRIPPSPSPASRRPRRPRASAGCAPARCRRRW